MSPDKNFLQVITFFALFIFGQCFGGFNQLRKNCVDTKIWCDDSLDFSKVDHTINFDDLLDLNAWIMEPNSNFVHWANGNRETWNYFLESFLGFNQQGYEDFGHMVSSWQQDSRYQAWLQNNFYAKQLNLCSQISASLAQEVEFEETFDIKDFKQQLKNDFLGAVVIFKQHPFLLGKTFLPKKALAFFLKWLKIDKQDFKNWANDNHLAVVSALRSNNFCDFF